MPFDIYVFLDPGINGAMGAEYHMECQSGTHVLIEYINNDFIPIYMGNPTMVPGISLAFNECQTELVWLQKLTFFPFSAEVEYFILGPHVDTNMLAIATCESGYPKAEATSMNWFSFNECWHIPPRISAIEATSPISLRVDFIPCINSWGLRTYYTHFTMYDVSTPEDTVQFIEAFQDYTSMEGFCLVTGEPMVPGTTYRLEADDVCCDCHGCNDSSFEFTYEGGFEDRPDLDIVMFRAPVTKPDSCASIPIEFSVINHGSVQVDSFDILIEYGESPDPILTLYHETHYDLYPESTVHTKIYAPLPNNSSTSLFLKIDCDTDNNVTEWIEFNNDFYRSFRNYNPVINSVDDFPGDYGEMVTLKFNASYYDYIQSGPRVDYEIYRRDLDGAAWTCIDTIPGNHGRSYSASIPTEADSTVEGGLVWSAFTVNAIIDYGLESYMSCPDSGYSLDNLGDIGIELVSSSLVLEGSALRLTWTVILSEDPGGSVFEIQRLENEGPYDLVSNPVILNDGNMFWFEDTSVQSGNDYRYRMFSLSAEGTRQLLLETESMLIPRLPLSLMQNRPNPFNPVTEIEFFLPRPSFVNLTVYDITGRVVKCLVNEEKDTGNHITTWDGLDRIGNKVSSGIYLYRIKAGKEAVSRKMVLLK